MPCGSLCSCQPKEGVTFTGIYRKLLLQCYGIISFFLLTIECDRTCYSSSQYALLHAHQHPMHFYKCQKLCVFSRSAWPPNIYSAHRHSVQSFLIASLQIEPLGVSSLIGCRLPYLSLHVILLFAFHQVYAEPELRYIVTFHSAARGLFVSLSAWVIPRAWFVYIAPQSVWSKLFHM